MFFKETAKFRGPLYLGAQGGPCGNQALFILFCFVRVIKSHLPLSYPLTLFYSNRIKHATLMRNTIFLFFAHCSN